MHDAVRVAVGEGAGELPGEVRGALDRQATVQVGLERPRLDVLSNNEEVAAMLDGMIQDFERATGPWHVEWVALPEAFGYAAGALHQARFMLGGLIVDAARMAKNLTMTHGLIVAEAVMMALAPHIGRNEAHDLVYDACRVALENDCPLLDVLLETPAVAGPLGPDRLRELTDPANYLGAAPEMVDRLLAGR